ncbi:MAG: peptidylprolyl isomerase [Candidatus Eisenbacteria bacterium]
MMRRKNWIPAAAALAALCLTISCSSGGGESAETANKAGGAKEQVQNAAAGGEMKDAVAEGKKAVAENPLLDFRALNEVSPAVYKAKFETTKGDFVVEVFREWAPRGADRFYNLVKNGFYDETRFFRVLGFMAQIGIQGPADLVDLAAGAQIPDDQSKKNNTRGMVSFATARRPNADDAVLHQLLGQLRFARSSGLLTVQGLRGRGGHGRRRPQQRVRRVCSSQCRRTRVHLRAGECLPREELPNLDYVKKATIVGK